MAVHLGCFNGLFSFSGHLTLADVKYFLLFKFSQNDVHSLHSCKKIRWPGRCKDAGNCQQYCLKQEILELDFWRFWKLLFRCLSFSSIFLLFSFFFSLLWTVFRYCFVVFPLLFLFHIHFAFLLITLVTLLTSPFFLLSIAFFDFSFSPNVCNDGVSESETANGWPWLQACSSVCLALCTEMSNSLINTLDVSWCGYMQQDFPRDTGTVERVT